jgi:hypothetical protein
MTDRVDKFLHDQREQVNRQELRRYVLHALGERYWEALCTAIKQDVEKLNAKALPLLKAAIEINSRGVTPNSDELHIDCLAYPALYLTLRLDLPAEHLKIDQVRIASLESSPEMEITESLQIGLTNNSTEIEFIDTLGNHHDISGVSRYLLIRFLNR